MSEAPEETGDYAPIHMMIGAHGPLPTFTQTAGSGEIYAALMVLRLSVLSLSVLVAQHAAVLVAALASLLCLQAVVVVAALCLCCRLGPDKGDRAAVQRA